MIWSSVFYPWQREPKQKEGILTGRNAMGQTDPQWDEIGSRETRGTYPT